MYITPEQIDFNPIIDMKNIFILPILNFMPQMSCFMN